MRKIILFLGICLLTFSLSAQTILTKGMAVGRTALGDRITVDSIISTTGLNIQFYSGGVALTPSVGGMVYPGAGIAVSTGIAWGASVADASANWNTSYTDRLKWDGGATGLTAATGRTSLGATTVGAAFFMLTNPSAISFVRINADNSITAQSAANFKTDLSLQNVTNESKATMFTAPTFTGSATFGTIANSLIPTTNDVPSLGDGTYKFSDLFLASGGTINFNNGDITFTHGANLLSIAGGGLSIGGGYDIGMTGSLGATGARLTKIWTADLEITNTPTIGGVSISTTYAPLASPLFTGMAKMGGDSLATRVYARSVAGVTGKLNLADSVNYANGYMTRYDGVTGDALKLNLADSALMAGGYTSYADGLVVSSGLTAKLNKADSALMAGGYFSYSDGILKLNKADSALMAGGYFSYSDGVSGLALKLNKADSALMAGGYTSYADGLVTSSGLTTKLNKADSALMAGGYFSYSDGISGLALKLNKADSALMAGGYFSYSDGLLKANTASPTFTGTVVINTAINPDADGGAEMGTNALRFNHVYGDSIHANWFGNSDFKLGSANDKLTFNGDTLTATSANFRSLESYVNRLRVGASAGSAFLIDSITKSGTTIKFYDGATQLSPVFGDSVSLEKIVTLQSDTVPLFVFGAGGGNEADTALFTTSTLYGSFFNKGSDSLIITELRAVMLAGTTPLGTDTLSVQIYWNDTINKTGVSSVSINTNPLGINSVTVGTVDASFNNSTIPPNVWVFCKTPGVVTGRKPNYLSITLSGHKINRKY